MTPAQRDSFRPSTKDDLRNDKYRDDEERKRRDEAKGKPKPPPKTRDTVNTEKDAKELQDTPMIDAGCDPIEPKQVISERDDRPKRPEPASRHPSTRRDLPNSREYSETEKHHNSKSSDNYRSEERGLVSRSAQSGRDDYHMARSAAGHASESHGQATTRDPTSRRQPKEDGFVQKAGKVISWMIGGQSYETYDPPALVIQKMHAEKIQLEGEKLEIQRNFQWLQQEHDNTRNKAGWLEVENRRLLEEQEAQSSQVRMAQELLLKNNTVHGALADEDRTIRQNFRSLQSDIKDWGRDWAHGDIGKIDSLENKEHAEAMIYLSKIIRLDEEGKLPKWMSASEKMVIRAPQLVLSALLSHEICEGVFDQPFRLLEASTAEIGEPERRVIQPGDETVKNVYIELARYDESKAQIWRCKALDILDPSVCKTPAAELAKHDAERRRKELAKELSRCFLKGPAVTLLRGEITSNEEKMRTVSLERILLRALDMSARLWKQPTILRCNYFRDLVQHPFKNGLELVEAHPLHQLGVRGEDEEHEVTRLDDHSIMMVFSPAIIALGNSDGENYNTQHRVWAKGVVWLDE